MIRFHPSAEVAPGTPAASTCRRRCLRGGAPRHARRGVQHGEVDPPPPPLFGVMTRPAQGASAAPERWGECGCVACTHQRVGRSPGRALSLCQPSPAASPRPPRTVRHREGGLGRGRGGGFGVGDQEWNQWMTCTAGPGSRHARARGGARKVGGHAVGVGRCRLRTRGRVSCRPLPTGGPCGVGGSVG